jgi:hypothetical protein
VAFSIGVSSFALNSTSKAGLLVTRAPEQDVKVRAAVQADAWQHDAERQRAFLGEIHDARLDGQPLHDHQLILAAPAGQRRRGAAISSTWSARCARPTSRIAWRTRPPGR